MNRIAVLKKLQENRKALRQFGIVRLALFGSCARGESTAASDLDFLVDLEEKSFDIYMDLKYFLEDLFQCDVDLVLVDAIKPRLREIILGEAIDAPGL